MPHFNRPDHPDFWLLSQIVIDNDTAMDKATISLEDRVGQVIDVASLRYMADQRALRATGPNPFGTAREQARIAAVYMDAFIAGATFQARKDRGDQEIPNSPEDM